MIEGALFVGAVVVALVDALKDQFPQVKGKVTVLAAALVGGLISLVDQRIGLEDMTLAAGVMAGLAAAGAVGVAKRVG